MFGVDPVLKLQPKPAQVYPTKRVLRTFLRGSDLAISYEPIEFQLFYHILCLLFTLESCQSRVLDRVLMSEELYRTDKIRDLRPS